MNALFQKYIERFENIDWIEKQIIDYPIKELLEFYKDCKNNGLLESAVSILKYMCKAVKDTDEKECVINLLNEEIFLHDDLKQVTEYFNGSIAPILAQQKTKELLFFHLYGWLYGGAERAISKVLNELCKDFDVVLGVFSPVENNTYPLDKNIKFLEIQKENNKVGRLYLLLRILNPAVFIGNNNSIPSFLPIYEWLQGSSIKTVAYCHEYYFFMHQNTILCESILEKDSYLGKADVAVFLTNFSTNAYSLVQPNGARIPNALSFEKLKKPIFKENSKRILAVGRYFDYIKRIDLLLQVFAKVRQRDSEAELIVVGEYNLDLYLPDFGGTVNELLLKLGLNEQSVHFVGNQKDVSFWYQKGDLLLLTSDNEGFGMVLVEAGLHGLPCVIFDIPGLEDIIIDGVNGFIVPRKIDAMAEKTIELLENNSLRKEMSKLAYDKVQRFSVENVGCLWRKLLTELVHQKDKKAFNIFLNETFREQDIDIEKFTRTVIHEYDNVLCRLAQKRI